jgi:hypothetical protein
MSQPRQPVSSGDAHQVAQSTLIVAALEPLVTEAMGMLDPKDLAGSLPKVKALIASLVHTYGRMSASLAVRYYQMERKAAGVTAPYTILPALPAGPSQIDPSIDWATKDLWGPVNTEPIEHRGATLQPFQDRLATAQTNVQGVTENLTLDAGRDTIIQAVQTDEHAKGWARVPEPGACWFCAMLATRGAVYTSEQSATFEAHDHCRCHVEPVFNAYEPTHQIRQWQALYADATRGVYGMKAAQIAFRRAYEGRTAPTPAKTPALV